MAADKTGSDKPAAEKPKKPTGIELTEEDLKRVGGGLLNQKEETTEKKGG